MDKKAIFSSVLEKINWQQLKNGILFDSVDFTEPIKNVASSEEFKKFIESKFDSEISKEEIFN